MKWFLLLLVGLVGLAVFYVGPGPIEDLLDRRLTGAGQDATTSEPGPTTQVTDSDRVLIRSVTVNSADGGTVYNVRPTRAGRAAFGDDLDVAWQQAVDRGVPNTRGLYDQFRCHPLSVVARAKQTWDLETWRPSVGLARTMVSGCNPT